MKKKNVSFAGRLLRKKNQTAPSIVTTAATIVRYPVVSTIVVRAGKACEAWRVKDQTFFSFRTARAYSRARFVVDNDFSGKML